MDTTTKGIKYGFAVIPERVGMNAYGKQVWGWALPGGGFTADRKEAVRIAEEIDRLIDAGLPSDRDNQNGQVTTAGERPRLLTARRTV